MRITVNLATRPFVELRPFFLRLRIFMAALAVIGVAVLIASHILQKKLDVAESQINAVHSKVVTAQNEKRDNERRMHEAANAAVLTRAHFLNAQFLRKSFSWTAVMMDLETVLPTGVQVTSIEPQTTQDGDVMIHLRVSGDRGRAVQLVRNLERSKRFRAPRLTGEASQTKEGGQSNNQNNNVVIANNGAPPAVEFEILANYIPLPEGEKYAAGKSASEDANAEKKEKAVGARSVLNGTPNTKHHATGPHTAAHKPSHGTPPTPVKGGAR
jgi:type IV pilus assembly protein PilN